MKRALLAVAVVAMLAMAPTASASGGTTTCNGTFTGATFNNISVPTDGTCILIASDVNGSVFVGKRAYFEASATTIDGSVTGLFAGTIFLHDGTSVGGSVTGFLTQQIYLFDSSANNVTVIGSPTADGIVNLCGNNVNRDVTVVFSGTDILIGDPLTIDCGGNTIGDDLYVVANKVEVELIVRGNTIGDDATVSYNKGPADKAVEGNIGGDRLSCKGNTSPFTAALNVGWNSKSGQCSGP